MARHELVCSYLILVILACYCSSESTPLCSPAEAEALLTVDSQCGWSGPDCCSFYGVTCDEAGHVTEVDLLECSNFVNIAPTSSFFQLRNLHRLKLQQFNVNSSIPDEIGQLTELRQLTVYSFRGSIPSAIGNLSKLENLGLLSGNSSQTIPDSFRNLRNLESINLVDIGLTGGIPHFFRNLTSLRYLTLDRNRLSGRLPFFLFKEMNLSGIFAADNLLQGRLPRKLPASSSLTSLYLSNNNLSGSLPSWLSLMQVVQLSNNRLSGPIKEFQTPLTSVLSIRLDGNRLEGIPSSLFGMVNCLEMMLGDNRFSGDLDFRELREMNALMKLNVSWNSGLSLLNVERESLLKNGSSILPRLETLNLDHCNLTYFPSFLGALSGLREVSLAHNRMRGPINTQEGWSSLITLDASFNNLEGSLENMNRTGMILFLSHNRLTGEIPATFCTLSLLDLSFNNFKRLASWSSRNCQDIFYLNLENNNLTGSIPIISGIQTMLLSGNKFTELTGSVADASALSYLDIGHNSFSGPFPSWFGDFKALKILIISSNNFSGSIVGTRTKNGSPFPKLLILDASHNKFTGLLRMKYFRNFEDQNLDVFTRYMNDDALGVFVTYKGSKTRLGDIIERDSANDYFTSIDLSNNLFSGSIPSSIGNLGGLMNLNLNKNNLDGEIPTSFGNLTKLRSLDLSSNNFVGKVPEDLLNLESLVFGNFSSNRIECPIPVGNFIC